MARPKNPVPKYTHHKKTGQARIWLNGRYVYLGPHGSEESKREYERIVAELNSGTPAAEVKPGGGGDRTVDEVLLGWWVWAEGHYRRADGTPTNELSEYKYTLRPLRKLYGHTPAKDFGPLALKTVRKALIASGNARTLVNARIGRIKRVFKWAASEQLVPVATYTALTTVSGLQRGRTEARESKAVGPVDPAHVAATLPHLNRQVAGLIRFMALTGCRPGEACAVRRCDIDTSGTIWFYRPPQHKTAHRGKARVITIGPKAQEVLKGYFVDDPTAYLFDPARATAEMRARRSAARRTPRYPSHMARNAGKVRKNPERVPKNRYTPHAVAVAVGRAVDAANRQNVEAAVEVESHVAHWHPNQLRHLFGTAVRKAHGLEAAQVLLGHAKADVTEIYAEKNIELAARVAAEVG